jgi:hypothetical protein
MTDILPEKYESCRFSIQPELIREQAEPTGFCLESYGNEAFSA